MRCMTNGDTFLETLLGLLLVYLNFWIYDVDLLVDGVGYLIVAAGCRGLSSLSSGFETARILCFVLVVLWLIGFAVRGDISLAQELVMVVVVCAMMWQLLAGIGEFALSRQAQDLAKRSLHLRVAYVAMMSGVSVLLLAKEGSGHAGATEAILGFVMVVVIGRILHLIHRVKVELAGSLLPKSDITTAT